MLLDVILEIVGHSRHVVLAVLLVLVRAATGDPQAAKDDPVPLKRVTALGGDDRVLAIRPTWVKNAGSELRQPSSMDVGRCL